jgi:hypothetical protein
MAIRRGPKFELTRDMVIENVLTVMKRIGAETLSRRDYDEHGSFSSRAIVRKWKWAEVCRMAGIPQAKAGRPGVARRTCTQCHRHPSMSISRHCELCYKRINRQSRGML